ncbi:MAG: hypothetical protein QXL29_08140 [Zestosphaera sp.]
MTYNPHEKYVKVGECRRCGRCCDLHCPHFKWVALRNIKAGETFESGKDAGYIAAYCDIYDQPITSNGCTPEQRKNFPFNPHQTPPKCGFKWVKAM